MKRALYKNRKRTTFVKISGTNRIDKNVVHGQAIKYFERHFVGIFVAERRAPKDIYRSANRNRLYQAHESTDIRYFKRHYVKDARES